MAPPTWSALPALDLQRERCVQAVAGALGAQQALALPQGAPSPLALDLAGKVVDGARASLALRSPEVAAAMLECVADQLLAAGLGRAAARDALQRAEVALATFEPPEARGFVAALFALRGEALDATYGLDGPFARDGDIVRDGAAEGR
jgi:hypothetical protein